MTDAQAKARWINSPRMVCARHHHRRIFGCPYCCTRGTVNRLPQPDRTYIHNEPVSRLITALLCLFSTIICQFVSIANQEEVAGVISAVGGIISVVVIRQWATNTTRIDRTRHLEPTQPWPRR